MATRNLFLANWVKNAYGMEMGLVPVLEKQAREVGSDRELRQGIDQHLQKTRQHVEMLRSCLQRMGENVAGIEPSLPFATVLEQADGHELDATHRTALVDYVTEEFEVASYRALASLANMVGDHETAQVCEQILHDELAMSGALDRRLSSATGVSTPTTSTEENVRLARENFDTLNAHDLDRFDRMMAEGYRAEAPGAPGLMDKKQNHTYIERFLTAFPDLHFEVERIIASGNDVVVSWTSTGTQTGPLRNPDGSIIPATGRKVTVPGNTILAVKDGKIAQAQVTFDTGAIMQQLGLMPGVSQVSARDTARDIVHIEIPASDRQYTARFYHEMFGWDYEHMEEPQNYTTFRAGNMAGGFPDLDQMPEPGEVILYVASDDIDADLRKAGRFGARTVTHKTEIPGMGWYAILADPSGNHIGLFTATEM